MEKSYVALENAVCQVCGKEHATGVLLNRRLQKTFNGPVTTHFALCEEHQKQKDEGYVFLIGAQAPANKDNLKLQEAIRTGELISIKRHVAEELFNVAIPEQGIMFCEPGVIKHLQKLAEQAE